MAARPRTIDGYLDRLGDEQRSALESVRRAIKAAAPRAEECFSYGMPAFRLDGKVLVGFAATATHCAFYPMSGTTTRVFAADLAGYDTSKGTIRFDARKVLPVRLIRKLVKARIVENSRTK